MKKRKMKGILIYALIVAVIALIIKEYRIPVLVIGAMGLLAFLRTSRLEENAEALGGQDKGADEE